MVERNLGSVAFTTTAKRTAATSPNHAVAEARLDEVVPATELDGGEERLAKDGAAGDEGAEHTSAEGPKRPLCTTVFRWAG